MATPRLGDVVGTIFDIQFYSLHDGPGLRTNVFFKGCPLGCKWCCNPESMNTWRELALIERRCFACGDCLDVCEPAALSLSDGTLRWDPEVCNQCGRCVEVCVSEAMCWMGRQVTAREVIDEVMRDAPFYAENGGLTLTGGEPTLQPEFAEAVLRLAKEKCLHTAIETCGHAPWGVFERLLPYLDLVLYDLKHMDSQRHMEGTGVPNEQILENARRIAASGQEMIIRVPLIPGFNANEEDLLDISRFVRELGLEEIHLLPYHRLGQPKYKALGRRSLWESFDLLEQGVVERLADLVRGQGLRVVIGG
ncbi:MAG: hypothetical protein A2Y73_02185 [Chloroflexi bacterium RBG_13_56_8]|nr:MAG: hypothetical protein A2Y73_02185 [Chloroflexi bacterium RBG_13_56_8]